MEIERKYLISLDQLPFDLAECYSKELVQGYLNTEPVVRVRREGEEFFLTYKGKGLVAREEANLPLTQEAFEHLLGKADGIIIEKTRYFIPLDGRDYSVGPALDERGRMVHSGTLAELDVFHGDLDSLVFAEVEFDSLDQANHFLPPDWFGEDVSESGKYQNSRLSKYGLEGIK